MGVSGASLYCVPKQNKKDWIIKMRMEEELHRHPSYGSRRPAISPGIGRPRAKRAMKIFGIKPYRRRARKYHKSKESGVFPNLLLNIMPSYANHIWATDFTELQYHDKKIYVSTIIDLFTRKIVGIQAALRKGSPLAIQTLTNALFHYSGPIIFHSDSGSEYKAKSFINIPEECGITISRSRPGCPRENGCQESFYDKFKADLGGSKQIQNIGRVGG